MTISNPVSLTISRSLLRVLIKLNWFWGFLLVSLLAATVYAEGRVMPALGFGPHNSMRYGAARMIIVIGILAVPVTNVALKRLLAVVDTVASDPFRRENAERIQTIALALLVLNLMDVASGFLSMPAGIKGNSLDLGFAGWLSVFLLFVLARVFEQGARMREELEGTI